MKRNTMNLEKTNDFFRKIHDGVMAYLTAEKSIDPTPYPVMVHLS